MSAEALARLWGGLVPPIVTPLGDDGSLDVESLVRLRDRLITGGCAGVFVLGSTGEASYLTDERRRAAVAALADHTDGTPLLVGVVEPTAERVVDAVSRLGFDRDEVTAFVCTGPFYARASDVEIGRHFTEIAAALDRPVLAYNIPMNTHYSLPTQPIAELIHSGVLAGIKDSAPDVAGLAALIAAADRPDALYFTGADALIDQALAAGANGAVAGLANIAPDLFVAALTAHAGDDADSFAAAHERIVELSGLYAPTETTAGLTSTQVGSIKTALTLIGAIESDAVSAPMIRSSEARRSYVAAVLAAAGIT